MIDFVLPWVDCNDSDWQKEKAKYDPKEGANPNMDMRFRDLETLKYVLRSIDKYAPWYNKIHIITTGHYPDWLNINHEKINLITHEELYYKTSHLPTFNSSSIEMNLANLNCTTDKIVYLNDDTLLFNQLETDRFFQGDIAVDFLSHGWLPRNNLYGLIRGRNEWVHSLNNNLKLVNKTFSPMKFERDMLYHSSYSLKEKISNFMMHVLYKKFIWIEHWHHPHSYNMKTLRECFEKYEKEMMVSSQNRFRANNDLTQYLYRYWRLASQDFIPFKYNDGYVSRITSLNSLKSSIKYLSDNKQYNFVCFNDNMTTVSNEEFDKTKSLVSNYLDDKFSEKAVFEK